MSLKKTVLLVGCGAISKKHISAVLENSEKIRLNGVCDVDSDRAKQVAESYAEKTGAGKPGIYTDISAALDELRPDICAVATSSSYHAPLALRALESGCHVVLEKPMALSTRDAEALVTAAERANRNLAVCYITRYAPHVRKVKRYINERRFGRILHVSANVYWNRGNDYYQQASWRGTWDKDGGTLMNQCTHAVDLQQWFLGSDVKKIHGVTRRYLRPIESEDFGSAILECENGAIGTITGTVDVFPKNLSAELGIYGEKGTVVFGGTHMNDVSSWRFADEDEYTADEEGLTGHAALYADMIHAIETGEELLVDGMEGKKSLDIVLGIYASMRKGAAVEAPFDFDQIEMRGVELPGLV